ncbi:ribosome-associated translation inhibitor RaiA [Candidatus Kaiserbacteria bacterium]|nr:ribosome-associated translation inhibitor RaiA [Candidatus Kaiserbacteria bacterium]
MKINIKGTQYQLTSEVRDYLEKKLAAIGKFIDESQGEAICDVELEHQNAQKHGAVFRAEVNLNTHGEFFRVEDTGESMNAAIDAVHDEILRRLRKGKTRVMSNVRRGGAAIKKMMREG